MLQGRRLTTHIQQINLRPSNGWKPNKIEERDSIEMINNNNILPYLRKKISTLLLLSAAAIALMLLSMLVHYALFNLLQPVQAQTPITFQTPIPANYTSSTTGADECTSNF